MSFIDYGFNVFSFGPIELPSGLHSCGDCFINRDTLDFWDTNDSENTCCHVIIEHLIDLGTNTEHKLAIVKQELSRYKTLKLSDEQINQLRELELENEDIEKFSSRLESSRLSLYSGGNASSVDRSCVSWFKDSTPRHERPNYASTDDEAVSSPESVMKGFVSEDVFKSTVNQKDAELASLKKDIEAKETELQELRELNIKLDLVMEKMRDDIELLEGSSKISQSEIEDIVRRKNDELDIARESVEKLERQLEEERRIYKNVEQDNLKLQKIVHENDLLRKNLSNELKLMKRQVETTESSNASQANVIKQLQQERDKLDKQNCEQEKEIEKLVDIVKRLNGKYERAKADMLNAKDQLENSEVKVRQCHAQLEMMEQEIGRLICDLAECLGCTNVPAIRGISGEDIVSPLYETARELTRDVNKIVREHEQCRMHHEKLLREIERLGKINPSEVLPAIGDISELPDELYKLKQVVLCADNYRSVKMELKTIVDELVERIDDKRIEQANQVYCDVAQEASLSIQNLNKMLSNHDIYQKCQNFLLTIVLNLEEALNGAEKTMNDFGIPSSQNLPQIEGNFENEDNDMNSLKIAGIESYSIIESVLPKDILERVKNSTQAVIRITTALRSEGGLKPSKKILADFNEAITALKQVNIEKSELEKKLTKYMNKIEDLSLDREKLECLLNEQFNETERVQSRLEANQQEMTNFHKQLEFMEKKLIDSKLENDMLIKKSDELIETWRRDLDAKNLELQQYREVNDILNSKVKESNQIIEQLRSKLVQESLRLHKIDGGGLEAMKERIAELTGEKEDLINNIGDLVHKIDLLRSQLVNAEGNNVRLRDILNNMMEENGNLQKKIAEDHDLRLKKGLMDGDGDCKRITAQCDEMIQKIASITSGGRVIPPAHEIEKEIKNLKETLRQREKEVQLRESEISEKNRLIDKLEKEVKKASEANVEKIMPLTKQIQVLTRERDQLKKDLKQTLIKYDDKLAEMHKQYKHNEIELHKNHNDSIKKLEAKYNELMKEEGKISGSANWLQSLNDKEIKELHDKICKSACFSPYVQSSKDVYDDKSKKNTNKSIVLNYNNTKKPIPLAKKDPTKTPRSPTSKPCGSSRRLTSARTLSNHSINIPEKEYSR